MNPIYIKNFFNVPIISELVEKVEWVNEESRRRECFMSDSNIEYKYIDRDDAAIYKSMSFLPVVKEIMEKINKDYGYNLDICFLNLYIDQHKALGWHSDDSHTIDQTEPIAVVSFGAEREIWIKPKGYKDAIQEDWKQLLENGSLFIMPSGFQEEWLHKIPKTNSDCTARVSLTFRKYKA